MRSTVSPAVLTVAAALLLAGCSGGSTAHRLGPAPAVDIGLVPTPTDAGSLRLPLQEYLPGEGELEQLNRAQRVLTDQCMTRYGFRYRLPEVPPAPAVGNTRRYGLADPVAAAASGYGTYGTDGGTRAPRPEMDPTEQLVLGGEDGTRPGELPGSQAEVEKSGKDAGRVNGLPVPPGGCTREAYLKLWVPTADAPDPLEVQELDAQAYDRSRREVRVNLATEKWQECMARKGYQAKNPVSPMPELGLRPETFTGPEGIGAATADVACKRETNLVGIWFAVESAYQRELIEEHGELLRSSRRQLDDSLRLAAGLVAASG
ncbi:hypothetical protein ACIRBX_17110 [Kitasatospora sp. NPDC096147]|uniref:hypothetical protein n=1 Tax=Kitasatospora sp. NPDC096147 TaxID=3364093 RepID=UPI00381C0A0E